ncbi:diguanylate cyclase [Sulfuricurvum sp.]|uniref:diguanylate cyclase n=1 Tax=Sulfuricurvum sp. TaxID=2025608 RepID=UPI002E3169B1|nr:diguanylate cyclase [Sulfuricurvum sp.]HEX5329572.1 diguanylate cyclase [Sulfuricurvum sp.]
MNIKFRAQLIIAFIVIIVSATLTFYHFSQEKRYVKERTERSSQNIKHAFDAIVDDTEHLYRFRTLATLSTAGVIDAVKKQDTQALYKAILPRFNALKNENPHLIIMQFHAPDGRSILRVHLKDKFGDNIAQQRPMLRKIHQEHRMISGFEGGLGGIAFRVIMPIFDEERYIGAVEYGVDVGYFVDRIKRLSGSESIVLIHKGSLGAADRQLYSGGIGHYFYSTDLKDKKVLMEQYAFLNDHLEPRRIDIESKSYEINPLFLKDSKNRDLGVIIAINDVSGASQNTMDALVGSVLVTVVMMILLWGLFEYTFNGLIGKVDLQERYINTILDSQQNIVIVTDGFEIIFANRSFFDYLGFDTLKAFKREHACICEYFEADESAQYLMPMIDGMVWTEYLLLNESQENQAKMSVDGKTSIFTVTSKKMDYKGKIRHVVVFTDITRLNELATQDVLTGVANRFQFDKALSHSISLAQRYERGLSIILLDIDHFKKVNDIYGHLVGDDVLKKFTQILINGTRKSDIVARWGGEEFVVLLPDTEFSSAIKLAEILRLKVAEGDFSPVERVTCSIGITRWNEGETPDQLLKRVDKKLYAAKDGGRNRVVS